MLCNEVSHTTVNWHNLKNMKSFGSQLATTGLTSQCTSTKTHSKYCKIILLDQIPENVAYVTPTASMICCILTSIYCYAGTSMRCPLKAYVLVPYPAPFPTAPPRPPADPSHQVHQVYLLKYITYISSFT